MVTSLIATCAASWMKNTCDVPAASIVVVAAPAPTSVALPVRVSTWPRSRYRPAGRLIVVVPEAGAAAQSGSAVPFAYSVASRSEHAPSPAWTASVVVLTVTVVAAAAADGMAAASAKQSSSPEPAIQKVIRRRISRIASQDASAAANLPSDYADRS